ncbi:Oidioi.mRNA.OKI2018_I69.chr2.g5595.t1.cds [Oikopleura dioica]|uniref:Oidioi.mRNA.OKI2018_I69.chr2.g5595.t1.cds n=1 Tax=Oikopleura dioica TaxID=34765 RepID=A0ABN7T6G5_OIKDI|nr:Oidioi.mRNA.OKI2018_I69.chr2.g5595.t1.cds [Oikopleura dioica]
MHFPFVNSTKIIKESPEMGCIQSRKEKSTETPPFYIEQEKIDPNEAGYLADDDMSKWSVLRLENEKIERDANSKRRKRRQLQAAKDLQIQLEQQLDDFSFQTEY